MTKVLIVDGNNLMMRAVHATVGRAVMTADGVSTAALVVFVNSLSKFVCDERPDAVVVCWDSGGSDYRSRLYPAYKESRKTPAEDLETHKHSSAELIHEFLALAGIPQMQQKGVEADDLIAEYWRVHRRRGDQVVLLSNDKDFLQLLDDGTEQLRLSSGGAPTDRWTAARVRGELLCEPFQLPVAMSLAGDLSDDVPGVRGYGMKTAIKKLTKAGWNVEKIPDPRVQDALEQVTTSFALVDLIEPIDPPVSLSPVPPFRPTTVASAAGVALQEYLNRYKLELIRTRWLTASLWT